jgi:CubicO group peptidase (beta-lactamase class C family)
LYKIIAQIYIDFHFILKSFVPTVSKTSQLQVQSPEFRGIQLTTDDSSMMKLTIEWFVDRNYSLSAIPVGWLVRQLMVAFNAPGMTIAAAMDGQIVWSVGFGNADLSQRIPA